MVALGQYKAVLVGTWSLECGTSCYLVLLGQYRVVLFGTWWYWVRRRQHWLIHDGTGSVYDGTGWYLVVLGH